MAYKKGEKLRTAFATYAIDEFLGAGGAGEVYAVRDPADAVFAAKILDTTQGHLRAPRAIQGDCSTSAPRSRTPTWRLFTTLESPRRAQASTSRRSTQVRCVGTSRKAFHWDMCFPLFGQILDGVEASHLNQLAHGA